MSWGSKITFLFISIQETFPLLPRLDTPFPFSLHFSVSILSYFIFPKSIGFTTRAISILHIRPPLFLATCRTKWVAFSELFYKKLALWWGKCLIFRALFMRFLYFLFFPLSLCKGDRKIKNEVLLETSDQQR